MDGLAPHGWVSFGLRRSRVDDSGERAVSESLWPAEDLDAAGLEIGSIGWSSISRVPNLYELMQVTSVLIL